MLRRTNPSLYKVLLVESPNKVRSVNEYVNKIPDMNFGRKDLQSAMPKKGNSSYERTDVFATIGHFREMTRVTVCADNNNNNNFIFVPEWKVTDSKTSRINEIKAAIKHHSDDITEVILATDPDREGELISAHALEEIVKKTNRKVAYSRAYIHSITQEGVLEAMKERKINFVDDNLANAANARHLLDRVFGFYGSRLANSIDFKIRSVGRVQSPALILVHDRCKAYEDVINNRTTSYGFSAQACFPTGGGGSGADSTMMKTTCLVKMTKYPASFLASSSSEKDGSTVGSSSSDEKDSSSNKASNLMVAKSIDAAEKVCQLLNSGSELLASPSTKWSYSVKTKTTSQAPPVPLTLQALILSLSKKFRMSSAEVTECCQRLFVAGLITYPRTDSSRINDEAVEKLRKVVEKEFGKDCVESAASLEKKKAKKSKKKEDENVEDAHEAIRPTNPVDAKPSKISSSGEAARDMDVYQEIRNTTLASVMIPRKTESCTVIATPSDAKARLAFIQKVAEITGDTEELSAVAKQKDGSKNAPSLEVVFHSSKTVEEGWKKAFQQQGLNNNNNNNKQHQSEDEEGGEDQNNSTNENLFETMKKMKSNSNNSITFSSAYAVERKQSPPPLFMEGTLIEELKRNGIGRPSTYSSIMETLHRRQYVVADKNTRKLHVTPTGEYAVKLSRKLFPEFVALDFTAAMEGDLDKIISGADVNAPVSKCLSTLLSETRKACVDSYSDATQLTESEKGRVTQAMPDFKVMAGGNGEEIDFELVLRNLRTYLQKNYKGMKSWDERKKESDSYFSNKQNKKPAFKPQYQQQSTSTSSSSAFTKPASSSSSSSNRSNTNTVKSKPASSSTQKTAPTTTTQSGLKMPTFRKKK